MMPYANIGVITTANTFDHWRIVTNQLANVVNQVAGNTVLTKDDGSWVLVNGSITLSNTKGTTFTVASNATISGILTVGNITLTGNISGSGSFPQANSAYHQANGAFNQANTAYNQANVAYNQANTAYGRANTAANTARVSANGGSTLSAQQLNFVNSPTVTVSVVAGTGAAAGNANISFTAVSSGASADVAYNQANAAFNQANTAYNQANGAFTQANTAYTQANTAYNTANTSANTVQVYANSSLVLSKANLNFVNSTNILVSVLNNGGQANVGFAVNTAAITSLGTLTALDISGSAANIFDTPIVTVTSSGSYADNAAGKILLCDTTSPTAVTLTFHSAPKANFSVTIIRNGTGNVIIANTSSVQKQNTTSFTTANISTQFGAATVVYTATNKFILLGDIT